MKEVSTDPPTAGTSLAAWTRRVGVGEGFGTWGGSMARSTELRSVEYHCDRLDDITI